MLRVCCYECDEVEIQYAKVYYYLTSDKTDINAAIGKAVASDR